MSATITPTSAAQFAAATSRTLPALEEVRPGIWAITMNMPEMMPPYAFSYALLSGGVSRDVHLIDAGLDTDENWHALTEALERLDRSIADVASITVTHMHPDHMGLAPRIRDASGALLRMHTEEADVVRRGATFGGSVDPDVTLAAWGVPAGMQPALLASAEMGASGAEPVTVDEGIVDGEIVRLGDFALRAIHTPGHTSGHLCLALERENLLFTGDHVLPGINPGIALGGARAADPLGEYYASLDKLYAHSDAEVLPGHGFRFTGIAERCAEIRAHHGKRTSEVAAVLAADPQATIWEIASRITWSLGWANLAEVSLLSALSQTEMHVDRVRAAADEA